MAQYELNTNELLRVNHLSIQFGGLKAVDDLSFTIQENEIFGLIGPNGAGKTTVFNCITQFYKPNQGEILFRSNQDKVVNLTELKVHEVIRHGLVRTFQNVELIRELSILDNVMIGAHIDFKTDLFANAFKLPNARKEEQELQKKAMEILTFLDIADKKDQLVGGQPYGIMKTVELARTLMCNPKLIILDEPAAGLNDTETLQLAKTIRTIKTKFQCAILLVEHDMRLVMDICDQICAISFGKHLATGSPKEIQSNKGVQEAYLGTEDA